MQDDIYVGPPYFFLDPAVAPPTFLILEPPLFLFQNFWIRDRIWGRQFSNLRIRLLFRLRLQSSIQP